MSRKLATITRIKEILPIEGADLIEAVTMTTNGWTCVVRKGDFKVGDFGVYFEIDSFLPKEERYHFLDGRSNKTLDGVEGYRLRTIKLKKQISQGLILPMTEFPEIKSYEEIEARDVTELLGIKEYEVPEVYGTRTHGCAAGKFPYFVPKTDQVRIQSIEEKLLESLVGKTFEITEKLDGTSATYYYKDNHFGVCSRNLELKTSFNKSFIKRCFEWFQKKFLRCPFEKGYNIPKSTYEDVAVKYNLNETLPEFCRTNKRNLAIQGEIVGPGISSNRLKLNAVGFCVFDVFDIDKQQYLDALDRYDVVRSLNLIHVPVIDLCYVFEKKPLQEMIESANGKSILSDKSREGVVYKLRDDYMSGETSDNILRLSFKIISNQYLLKHGE
jgi:RNA ligase (TIGR02306 family)